MSDVITIPEAPADAGKLRQTIEISTKAPCVKHVVVKVNREDIDGLFNEKVSEIMKDQKNAMPGFRPGKVPRSYLIRKHRNVINDEVRRDILTASLNQLAEDANLAPVAPPQLDPEAVANLPEEGPFVYEFDIEVRPEFEVPEYKGLTLKRPHRDFDDADIQQYIQKLLLDIGGIVPLADDQPVGANCYITFDLAVEDEGKPFSTVKDQTVKVAERINFNDGSIVNFAGKVMGALKGQVVNLEVTLGDAVQPEALQKKTLDAKLTINNIYEPATKELTPEMLEEMEISSSAQLEEKVLGILNRNLEQEQRRSYRTQLMRKVLETTTIELPKDLILRQAQRVYNRLVMDMQSNGATDEEIESRRRELSMDSVQNVRVALTEQFVLQKIAELEKIEIEDADIDAEIDRLAGVYNESPRKVRAQLEQNEQIETLAGELLERRALDIVLNNAQYEDVEYQQQTDSSFVNKSIIPDFMIKQLPAPAATTEAE
ncbi:MAG: trigger factor [Zavarzinella sp.]